MFFKRARVFHFGILILLLSACSPSRIAEPVASAPLVGPVMPAGAAEMRDLSPTTEVVSNCGSGGGTVIKHPSISVITNYAIEWEVGGTTGVGVTIGEGVVPGGVNLSSTLEGHYATGFDQGIQHTTAWELPAEPDTLVEYTLMWREIWQPGYIEIRLADQSIVRANVRYRTGIQSDIVGKRVENCGGELIATPVTDVDTIPSTLPIAPSPTPLNTAMPPPVAPTTPPTATLYPHYEDNVGTGPLASIQFSDGMLEYSNEFLATWHGRLQAMNVNDTPRGCGTAHYNSERIWFGATRVTTISINGEVIAEYTRPTFRGSHGGIFDWNVSVGDVICVELTSDDMEYHLNIGPDVDIHYHSYCYRGHC